MLKPHHRRYEEGKMVLSAAQNTQLRYMHYFQKCWQILQGASIISHVSRHVLKAMSKGTFQLSL